MRIHLISVTGKVSPWIQTGIDEYLKRFPKEFKLNFINIPPVKRAKNKSLQQIVEKESELIFSHVSPGQTTIILDEKGQSWDTEHLSSLLKKWMQQSTNLNLIIGGPDGLPRHSLQKAQAVWSLSPLTFPHQIVKLLIIEQFYRAWSIMHNHPYHRGSMG